MEAPHSLTVRLLTLDRLREAEVYLGPSTLQSVDAAIWLDWRRKQGGWAYLCFERDGRIMERVVARRRADDFRCEWCAF
jgi:hypothetical protein